MKNIISMGLGKSPEFCAWTTDLIELISMLVISPYSTFGNFPNLRILVITVATLGGNGQAPCKANRLPHPFGAWLGVHKADACPYLRNLPCFLPRLQPEQG
jgi:hypothetical protein